MLTYSFSDRGKQSLYEYLYKQIKHDILTEKLTPKQKLPSKRSLAKHLNISTITVENAYHQLVAEGYIYAVPKSGFYVSDIPMYNDVAGQEIFPESQNTEKIRSNDRKKQINTQQEVPNYFADFVNNAIATQNFPFSTWAKLMRETMSEDKERLMLKSPSTGIDELRRAIADYLYQFRGMAVEPEQIVIGAGTEYLYGLIIQLLGLDKIYAVEDPGYQKIAHIYRANQVTCAHVPLDDNGINMKALEQSDADVLHISPSHHFPTGLVTPISRRHELLAWASQSDDRFIIEDDYDSEFRLLGKPIPALQSIDASEKVIYMNTFSKSLTSTIRISYMILPKTLMERYNRELNFYSCTVSNFEQYTLAKFIERGYFEKHINRMRNYYRNMRDNILEHIKSRTAKKKIHILEEDAGLHFLLKVDTALTDQALKNSAASQGIHVSCLSEYYHDQQSATAHTLVINYSRLNEDDIPEAIDRLFKSF